MEAPPGVHGGFGRADLDFMGVDSATITNDRQSLSFFAAARWPAGRALVAVENRGQAAAGGEAALNGSAGGKAQSGKSLMISLALASRLATPARKSMTNSR